MGRNPTTRTALNADIVDYSRLIADDFDATTAAVAEYGSLVERLVAENGGSLTRFVGDNFMALFPEPVQAVRAAIAISTEIEAGNADVPRAKQAMFRMGIDEGEVTELDGNQHGDALNVAARIQAIARPGGVSVSGRVYRALDEPALRFRSIGPQQMKNIPEQIEVFEFSDLPGDGSAAVRPALALETPTLAVLPIHTEDATEPVAAAAKIVRGDLLHRLVGIPDLDVIDAKEDEPGGAAAGAARYMLETGVHQVGDEVRVYAALFDVTTINVVKSLKWTTAADGLLGLSDRVADEVASAIEIELVVGEPAGLYAELGDPEAIEKIYWGWFHLRSDTPEGWHKALGLFQEVAESHPDQPFGHTLAAYAWWVGQSNGWAGDRKAALSRAWGDAQRAIDVGDPTAMGHTVQAAILMARGEVEKAIETIDEAQITRPTCDVTYGLQGSLRRYAGQWEKAVDLLDIAMRLTGVNKPWYPTVKACSLMMGGRYEQAAAIAEGVLEYQPNNLEALLVLVGAQVGLGLERRARATAELIAERFPSVDIGAWLDRNPYQDEGLVDRWKRDLVTAGALSGG